MSRARRIDRLALPLVLGLPLLGLAPATAISKPVAALAATGLLIAVAGASPSSGSPSTSGSARRSIRRALDMGPPAICILRRATARENLPAVRAYAANDGQ